MNGEMPELRTCGRPTKSGRPCKARLYGFEVACGVHATPHDKEIAEAYQRGHTEGFHQGYATGSSTARQEVERLRKQVEELTRQLDDAMRVFEIDGDQIVEIDGRYAYRWRGNPPLEVGEYVLLPENWLTQLKGPSGPHVGQVTGLGTTYRGELAYVLKRALHEINKEGRGG